MILQVKNLKKEFVQNLKKVKVLKDISLNVNAWDVYGFLGPNWAWKTTTLKCILGFLKPTAWEIKLFWKKAHYSSAEFRKIWYAPENTYFYDHLNGQEFLNFIWKLAWMNQEDINFRSKKYLEKLDLYQARNKLVKTYSKGMKQRLILVAAILNDPELIFLDEPMSGLDPIWRVLVKNLMRELKAEWKTIFFNTHVLPDVQEIANRFWIIYDGQIIYQDEVKNVSWSLEDFFVKKITEYKNN